MKNLFNKIKELGRSIYNKAYIALVGLFIPGQVFADNSIISGNFMDGATDGAVGGNIDTAFQKIEDVALKVVQGLSGILAIVMVGCFAWKAFSLSRCGDNPSERAKVIQGMIFFFIGAAAFGASFFFVGLFINILR